MWTVEYKVSEKDKALVPTGIRAGNAHAAWVAFGLQAKLDGVSYEVAHAFGPPASLASIAKVDRGFWPGIDDAGNYGLLTLGIGE